MGTKFAVTAVIGTKFAVTAVTAGGGEAKGRLDDLTPALPGAGRVTS